MTQKTPNPIPKTRLHLVLAVSLLTLAACGGGGGGNDPQANAGDHSVAVRSKPLSAGDTDCPNGGILVESGIDENGNGQLDDNEVDKTEKVCNGQDGADGSDGSNGLDALVSTSTINTGDTTCPNGGILVETGIDSNRNGSLDSDEVSKSEKLCNGQSGANGLNSLVAFSDEPAGANCPYGGMRVDSGLDDNGNGTLDSGEIDQTGFVCSHIAGEIGWQVAELIETNNAGAQDPQIAIDANGNAIAVWEQSDGTRDSIWANRYTAGSGWGSAQLIETDNAGNAESPQIAFDANGNAIAVWSQSDGTRLNIWANRYTASTDSWGTAELVENDDNGAVNPQIAIDANGNAIVVWLQSNGTAGSIWANRYIPNFGWGSAQLIETDDTGDARAPQIAIDANGNAIAVWSQEEGFRDNIWVNRYTASNGSWGTAQLIETDDGFAYSPQIAIDANGNAIAVWKQLDGARWNIRANRYMLGTDWGTAKQIGDCGNHSYCGRPQIAIDANGNAIAVWRLFSVGAGDTGILANRFSAGSGWGTAESIKANSGSTGYPQVTVNANGNAIAVWPQSDGTRYNIWANRYTPASGWGTAQLTETDNAGGASDPQIAIDANGNAIAVWEQFDGTRYNIWANRWLAP